MPRDVTFIKRETVLWRQAREIQFCRETTRSRIRGGISTPDHVKRHIRIHFYLAATAACNQRLRPLTRDASGPGFRSAEPHRFRSAAQPTDPDRRPSWSYRGLGVRRSSIEISVPALRHENARTEYLRSRG